MKRKDTVQRIEAELAKHPDITYRLEQRARHPAVRVSYGGKTAFSVFSGTPTEGRALKNNIAHLRRTIAELRRV